MIEELFPGEIALAKGDIVTQYIRCGKPTCRCRRGEPHGPYHYRTWRDGDKVRKVYVSAKDVAGVQAACDAYKALRRQLRDDEKHRLALTRAIRARWRTSLKIVASARR